MGVQQLGKHKGTEMTEYEKYADAIANKIKEILLENNNAQALHISNIDVGRESTNIQYNVYFNVVVERG